MKKLFAFALALLMFASCVANNPPTQPGEASLAPTGGGDTLLELAEGFEWAARPLYGAGKDISAAAYFNDKIWYIAGGSLFSINPDGTDKLAVPGFETIPGNYSATTLAGVEYIDEEAISYLAGDADGRLYFGGNGDTVYVCDSGGAKLAELTINNIIYGLTSVPGGTPLVLANERLLGGYKLTLNKIDFDKNSEGVVVFDLPPDVYASGIVSYGANWLAYDQSRGIFLINSETSQASDIVSFGGALLDAQTQVLGVLPGDKLLCLADRALCVLQRAPIAVKKTELTIAVCYEGNFVPSELSDAVLRFNTESADYKIVIQSYRDITKLNVEIIAGNIPDLMITENIPFESFARKDLFEDLAPYIDADPGITLVPSVRKALSTGDALYRLTPKVSVMSFAGSSEFLGTEPGWTFEEMQGYLTATPEGATVLNEAMPRADLLAFLLYQSIYDFVDWDSGTALFDTPDFKKLLELVATAPKSAGQYKNDSEQIKSGTQLAMLLSTATFSGYVYSDDALGGTLSVKGYPGKDRKTGVFMPMPFTLAMTRACTEKAAAWEFLRLTLTTDFGRGRGFPAMQSRYDAEVENALNEPQQGGKPMTQAQYDKFAAWFASIDSIHGMDSALQAIIEDEVEAYFEGQKTADEVTAIIQSRAAIYIAEQA
ncbi:MAG: hypothetical protein LBM98_03770 [Oscillospiraceae bacterium]|jgi:hypothetical protein|nr:hypothetical protein [Oscillospiraceae bacterium]